MIILISVSSLNLAGCAWVKGILSAIGSTSTSKSGTSVDNNKLHIGSKTTEATGIGYENLGDVNHYYMQQTGDYILRIVGLLGVLILFYLITIRFFKFVRRLVEKVHKT